MPLNSTDMSGKQFQQVVATLNNGNESSAFVAFVAFVSQLINATNTVTLSADGLVRLEPLLPGGLLLHSAFLVGLPSPVLSILREQQLPFILTTQGVASKWKIQLPSPPQALPQTLSSPAVVSETAIAPRAEPCRFPHRPFSWYINEWVSILCQRVK